MKKNIFPFITIICICLISCDAGITNYRTKIDLKGEWRFKLDPENKGVEEKWYQENYSETVKLPGTTDINKKGYLNKDTTTMHLNREWIYAGAAWYQKKITIPGNFENKHIRLFFERTKTTKVWIDSTFTGGSSILQSPQTFDVSKLLTPGEHTITVCVNNNLNLTPYGEVHIYSDGTQTNWNGIIGEMFIEASEQTYISNLQVYPDIDQKKINIKLDIVNGLELTDADIELFVTRTYNGKTTKLKPLVEQKEIKPEMLLEYKLKDDSQLWDEYQQPLYSLRVEIRNGAIKDTRTVPFGMRKFSAKGTQFNINGRTTFLRGKHDAAVFPLTGYTPTDIESWRRIYRIAKSYGINHYRFHSYTPPEAAFTAADMEGIYLQTELPFWGGMDYDTIADMQLAEGYALLKAYANHPSFVMFSAGNEIWSGHDRVERYMLKLKAYDDRPLYTMGSNNNTGYFPPRSYCDFFVAARTPSDGDTTLTHTRLTHAFLDSRDGGILNTQTPSTDINFSYAVSHMNMPIVSHEIGQYQIYPNYNEIKKYTGPVKAWNFEVFKQRLENAGMGDQDSIFQMASGAWSALCYKAEMEAAIRTKGLGGFQLLDLQDYPGQGTALVGILDAFMDSKGIVSKEVWLQSCNDVVLLLEFPKYVWTNKENFQAKAVVANYSNKVITLPANWQLVNQSNKIIAQGTFTDLEIPFGGLTSIGEINIDLKPIEKAEKLSLNIALEDSGYNNSYPVWVYPEVSKVDIPKDIFVTNSLDNFTIEQLNAGAKVLYFPKDEDVANTSIKGQFPPEFWNWGMFKSLGIMFNKPYAYGTLGLLMDPSHPIFNSFPTDFYTNWQWFNIVKAGNALILDSTSHNYRPIVQVIDNLERDHKLGLICEFKVGPGKILVCMSHLDKLLDKPEAVQLYKSILNYMKTEQFEPEYEIKLKELVSLF